MGSPIYGTLGDILDKLDKTAGVNSRELWITTTQTQGADWRCPLDYWFAGNAYNVELILTAGKNS